MAATPFSSNSTLKNVIHLVIMIMLLFDELDKRDIEASSPVRPATPDVCGGRYIKGYTHIRNFHLFYHRTNKLQRSFSADRIGAEVDSLPKIILNYMYENNSNHPDLLVPFLELLCITQHPRQTKNIDLNGSTVHTTYMYILS